MLKNIVDMGRRFVRQGGEDESSEDSSPESEPTDDVGECPEDKLVLEDWVDASGPMKSEQHVLSFAQKMWQTHWHLRNHKSCRWNPWPQQGCCTRT